MLTKNEMIFAATSPWDNVCQGQDKKVLFVCSAGILRSATGARMYASKYNTRAAGSERYALIPVTHDLILWANEIVFVHKENFSSVARRFDLSEKSYRVLNIPDHFNHMEPGLQLEFKAQYEEI